MPVITCIEDLRRLYERRVPRMFYDYTESGSWSEQTFRDNCNDYGHVRFRQKVAVDMSNRTTAAKIIGQDAAMPVALSPVGMLGMQCADGEIKAARAAKRFGVPFTLSTMSICSIEDVAEHAGKGFWFQLYVMRDQEFVEGVIQRAKDAGCSALVLTLDLQLLGQRHKDLKNGLTAPPRLTIPTLVNLATKIPWCIRLAATKRRKFGNIVGHAKGVGDTRSLMAWTREQFDPALDWDAVGRIKELWGGPLILKGILDPDDARRAADTGADAIIVSNHGGRQLDGALSSIRMLPSIVEAVGGQVEIHLDSGIRSGQDALKAIALGASCAWIGRAFVYGLGAMGEEGVSAALKVLHAELDTTMALCGERDVNSISREHVLLPPGFSTHWS